MELIWLRRHYVCLFSTCSHSICAIKNSSNGAFETFYMLIATYGKCKLEIKEELEL